jgi:hypothetical protein
MNIRVCASLIAGHSRLTFIFFIGRVIIQIRSTNFIGYFVVCAVLAVVSCPIGRVIIQIRSTNFIGYFVICVVLAVASCPTVSSLFMAL